MILSVYNVKFAKQITALWKEFPFKKKKNVEVSIVGKVELRMSIKEQHKNPSYGLEAQHEPSLFPKKTLWLKGIPYSKSSSQNWAAYL